MINSASTSPAAPRAPMFWAALALSGGIVFAAHAWRPPLWLACGAIALAVAALYFRARRPLLGCILAGATIFVLGALAFQGAGALSARQGPPPAILSLAESDQEVVVTAHLLRDPEFQRDGGYQRLEGETEQVQSGGAAFAAVVGVRLGVYFRGQGTESLPELHYGDRVRFPAKLRQPRNFRNPGALDYRGYLARQGIALLASTRGDRVEVLPGFAGTRLERWRIRIRRHLMELTRQLWAPGQAALIEAMLIGERAFIDGETALNFQRSGTYHVLVVSGMNVGILAFAVFWLLRRLRFGEVTASAASMAVAIGYAFLCDAGAPIVRATLMCAVYLGARLLYRGRSPLNVVGAAGLAIVVADPAALFEASFQLTFLAVVALGGIALPLMERITEPPRRGLRNLNTLAYDIALPPRMAQLRLDLRMLIDRLSRLLGRRLSTFALLRCISSALAVFDVLFVSAVMQVVLALPMALYFHRATMLSLPANAVVLPLSGMLVPACVGALALAPISLTAARPAAAIAGWILHAITGAVNFVGHMNAADIRVATPAVTVSALVILAFTLALVTLRRRCGLALATLAPMTALAVWIAAVPPKAQVRPGALEFTSIDVGQADSSLIVSPRGNTLLVDAAGPLGYSHSAFDFGENVISPYLWSRGISRLDAVAITHAHSDHIGGMPTVLANFRPRELWLGPNARTAELQHLLNLARELGIAIREFRGEDELDWGELHIRVLSPPREWHVAEEVRNNDSLVLQIAYRNRAVLVAGDAEKSSEHLIVQKNPKADLLKVAHNGSATSTSAKFLAAVRPRFAAISVGYHNQFQHPRPEVLARLAAAGVRTYRTDAMGVLTFYLEETAVIPPEELRY